MSMKERVVLFAFHYFTAHFPIVVTVLTGFSPSPLYRIMWEHRGCMHAASFLSITISIMEGVNY